MKAHASCPISSLDWLCLTSARCGVAVSHSGTRLQDIKQFTDVNGAAVSVKPGVSPFRQGENYPGVFLHRSNEQVASLTQPSFPAPPCHCPCAMPEPSTRHCPWFHLQAFEAACHNLSVKGKNTAKFCPQVPVPHGIPCSTYLQASHLRTVWI